MKITWFGQACFELVTADGTVIIMDPYHPMVGYAAHPRPAGIVTISHEHGDHNFTGWLEGTPEIIRGTGSNAVKGIHVTGLPSFHDENSGAQRGLNTIFVIEADGLRLCHLGDLGHEPDSAVLTQIDSPDVLFIPVGGFYTIDAGQAASIAKQIGARLTIPMHFATGVKETPIAPVEAFETAAGAVRQGDCTINVDNEYSGPGTVILEYMR